MLRKIYNACWYCIGGLILLAAVGISIIRLLLPGIDDYHNEIEKLAKHYSGYPISIDSVSAEWQGWRPQLFLDGVILLDPDSGLPLASFKSAQVSFAFFASIFKQEILPDTLIVSGANLKLVRKANGAINLGDENTPYVQADEQVRIYEKLTRWLLTQPHITLEDTSVLWIDEFKGNPPLQLKHASFHLRSWRQRVQINGSATLPRTHGQSIRFALDARGDLLSGKWSGRTFVSANKLKPSAWPDYSRWQDISIVEGHTDISIWSDWKNAHLMSAEGIVRSEDTLLQGNANSNLIRNLDARFEVNRNDNSDWSIDILLNRFSTWNGDWPTTEIRITCNKARDIQSLYISHILIEDLLPISGLYQLLPRQMRDRYKANALHGTLESLEYVKTANTSNWVASGRFFDMKIINGHEISSIGGISGKFITTPEYGRIAIKSDSIDILDQSLFNSPISNLEIDGIVDWYRDSDDSLLLRTESLRVNSGPQKLGLRGNIVFKNKSLPEVHLVALMNEGGLNSLKRFVPSTTNEKLKNWISHSIVSGNLKYGGMVLRGDLDNFPFRNSEGQFKINAGFSDITLDYHTEWPPIYQLDGELTIESDKLSMRVPNGDIYKSNLTDIQASIDNIYAEDHILHITGNARGSTGDAITFLQNSPLRSKNSVKQLFDLKFDGDIDINLDMDILLYPGEDSVSGDIRLLGNRVAAPLLGLTLENTKGHVLFSGDKIESKDLTADYLDVPASLKIIREHDEADSPIVFTMAARLDAAMIEHTLVEKLPVDSPVLSTLSKRLSGSSLWTLELQAFPQAEIPQRFSIQSDLDGLAIDLPDPLGKKQYMPRNFRLDFALPEKTSPIQDLHLELADVMAARVNNEGLTVVFGGKQAGQPTPKQVNISGYTEKLQLDRWLELLLDQDGEAGNVITKNISWSVEIDLTADALRLYNQTFNATRLNVVKQPTAWLIKVAGPEIEGRLDIPTNDKEQPIIANLNLLKLNPLVSGETGNLELDPRVIPPLSVDIDKFIYSNTEFGKLTLRAKKTNDGLHISQFELDKTGLNIGGQGDWQSVHDEVFSQFTIKLKAQKIAEMLNTFGYFDDAIKGGVTEIAIKASWPGSPIDFSLADIDGFLELNVSDGTFLNIEPKAGRIFGLLSVQTLPRRLALDFSDIFNKGFAFDTIHGNFTIDNGHAYTNDLTIKGPSAIIAITGRTGLTAQDYDQIVTVIPQVSDTLPVAGALFGPVGIGVGAVIFLTGKVFDSIPEQIDKLLGYRYSVKGSWENPIIKPLKERK